MDLAVGLLPALLLTWALTALLLPALLLAVGWLSLMEGLQGSDHVVVHI